MRKVYYVLSLLKEFGEGNLIIITKITVEMKLRRDTFIVFEDDPGFDSSVLIFVDIVVIRSPTIDQQMVDLDFTVSSTASSMCLVI